MRFLRHVGKTGCRATTYRRALSGNDAVILDSLGDRHNITVRFELNDCGGDHKNRPVKILVPPDVRDFLDFAVLIFIADETVSREGTYDGWTRSLDFILPVNSERKWSRRTPLLQETLDYLTGDRFLFEWHHRTRIPRLGNRGGELPKHFDTVCLFSGGLDSLLGAYKLLASGQRVLLAGHQADGIAASTQKNLASLLSDLFPGQVSLVQCRVARSQVSHPLYQLPDKLEERQSHRPRSLLFLAIAITLARAVNCRRIQIPENGLIALNSPLQTSRIGSLSTRTAHPRFLSLFAECVRSLGIFTGTIKNPFIYDSKTDMLVNPDRALRRVIPVTVSCAHAGDLRWTGRKGIYHCGYCVPCLYRRIALMGPGLDNPKDYAFDVFTSLAKLSNLRQCDFRALVSFAKRVSAASRAERHMMVLAHGSFSPDLGELLGPYPTDDFTPWADMLLRWANDFLEKARRTASHRTKKIVEL